MKLEYDEDNSCRKFPSALNTEVRSSVKVIYSYLNENPLRLTHAPTRKITHQIQPLPLQKIDEPRLIS